MPFKPVFTMMPLKHIFNITDDKKEGKNHIYKHS